MTMKPAAMVLLVLLASCASAPRDAGSSETTSGDAPVAPCGSSTRDWCPSPEGDVCGEHADEASCRADARCVGMPYVGESFAPCEPDGTGFWKNCPAVGCVSKPVADAKHE